MKQVNNYFHKLIHIKLKHKKWILLKLTKKILNLKLIKKIEIKIYFNKQKKEKINIKNLIQFKIQKKISK